MQYFKHTGSKRMSKTVALIVLLAFAFTMIVPASAFAAFSDVPSDHWALQQLDRVAARGIMGGYEDGTARPDNPVTQFEAIAMASRMMGLEYDEATQKGTYLPFKYPEWTGAYNTAVAAYTAGLIDANDFTHNASASREWVAKLLIKALEAEDELNRTANDALTFSDAAQISNKYLNYIKLAYDKGLLGGYTDGTFKPGRSVNRAELAAFLCRVENNLDTVTGNAVRGEVTAVSGVKVTINGEDGKTYSLYATTTSTLYNTTGTKIGVTELKVGDKVYVAYKNNLLNYLEIQSVKTPVASTVALQGDIRAIIDVKDTIIVMDADETLHTVIVDDNTKIIDKESKDELAFEDLQELMKISLKVDSKDQTASEIVVEANANGQRSGTIYNVDVYDKLITMQERSGLQSYTMANDMKVSISGMLTATASSLKEGDKATYTIEDGVMTAIAVGSSTDTYGGNAQVKAIDTDNRILTYVSASGELKSAYYSSGFSVTFKDGGTGSIGDVQQGDSIEINVSNNQVTKLTVTNRNVSEGLAVTLHSVDSGNDLITVKDENGNLKSYELSDDVKVLLYGETAALSELKSGMKVELTLLNKEVTRIQANDVVEGKVKAVSTSADTIQVITEDGTHTYDVSDDVTVKRYRQTSAYLGTVSVGDTVSLRIEADEVTVINIFEEVEMTIINKNNSSGMIRLEDEDENTTTKYIDEIEVFVDGSYTYKVSDLNIGDSAIATYEGNTMVKLEVQGQASGEVTDVDTSDDTITVRTFDGDIRTISFDEDSYIVKNGSKYTSLSKLSKGDRVFVDAVSGGKKITVLNSKTGEVRFATSTGIQFKNDTYGNLYLVVDNYYCHKDTSTTEKELSDLSTGGVTVTLYYTDQDHVYEIVID